MKLVSPKCITPMRIDATSAKDVNLDVSSRSRLGLREGDIVAIRVSGSNERAGVCAVCESEHCGMVNDDNTLRIRLSARMNPYFVAFILNSGACRREVRGSLKIASGQYSIDQDSFGSITIPVPEKDAQDEFAYCLKKHNGIKAEYRKDIESLRDERDALLDRYLEH